METPNIPSMTGVERRVCPVTETNLQALRQTDRHLSFRLSLGGDEECLVFLPKILHINDFQNVHKTM